MLTGLSSYFGVKRRAFNIKVAPCKKSWVERATFFGGFLRTFDLWVPKSNDKAVCFAVEYSLPPHWLLVSKINCFSPRKLKLRLLQKVYSRESTITGNGQILSNEGIFLGRDFVPGQCFWLHESAVRPKHYILTQTTCRDRSFASTCSK